MLTGDRELKLLPTLFRRLWSKDWAVNPLCPGLSRAPPAPSRDSKAKVGFCVGDAGSCPDCPRGDVGLTAAQHPDSQVSAGVAVNSTLWEALINT